MKQILDIVKSFTNLEGVSGPGPGRAFGPREPRAPAKEISYRVRRSALLRRRSALLFTLRSALVIQ